MENQIKLGSVISYNFGIVTKYYEFVENLADGVKLYIEFGKDPQTAYDGDFWRISKKFYRENVLNGKLQEFYTLPVEVLKSVNK